MNNILTLSNIDETFVPKVGQRAVDLSQIHNSKLPVPLSFVVPNIVFHEFLLQNKLSLEIRKLLNMPDKSDDDYQDIYAKIKYIFEYATIPSEFREELFEAYEALSLGDNLDAQGLLEEDEPVVNLIISPSYTWPSEKYTGVLLNIQGFENFLNALKSCWLSLYSPEHLKLRDSKKIEEFSSGIIVQKFVNPECTVEAYSKSLLGNYEIPINAYFGLPDITYQLLKDRYSISRETFGIDSQEIRNQTHILLRNAKSGTLIKRTLGKRGNSQKILDKYIFEIARTVDRASIICKKHFRLVIFFESSKSTIFFVDRTGERNPEEEAKERKATSPSNIDKEEKSKEENSGKESLSELINSPIADDPLDTEQTESPKEENRKKENLEEHSTENPQSRKETSDAFGWETTINSETNPEVKKTTPVRAIILDENNDEFILAPIPEEKEQDKKEEEKIKEQKEDDDKKISESELLEKEIKKEEMKTENTFSPETPSSVQKPLGPDNEFYMSIILDLEPTIDQEISRRYQEKSGKIPSDINSALEELEQKDFPQKEQVFKLKKMKEMLERGENINLDIFLEVTEKLRREL